MKKIGLIFVLITTAITLNAQTSIRGRKAFVVPPVASYFEEVVRAKDARTKADTTLTASIGQVIGKYKALKGMDLPYAGIDTPTMTGVPPALVDMGNGLIGTGYTNRPLTASESAIFTEIPKPFEVRYIFSYWIGQKFEEMFEPYNNVLSMGENSVDTRIIDNSLVMTGSGLPSYYRPHEARIVMKANDSAYYYLDNVLKGSVDASGLAPYQLAKTQFAIGVQTNSADFDFAAMYFHSGSIYTDAQNRDIYNNMVNTWNIGSQPNQVLADSCYWVRSGSPGSYLYTAHLGGVHLPPGVTLSDPSTFDYLWYWKDNETNYNHQTPFGGNSMTVTQAQFPNNDGSHTSVAIKCTIRPHSSLPLWPRYFSGELAVYDGYGTASPSN